MEKTLTEMAAEITVAQATKTSMSVEEMEAFFHMPVDILFPQKIVDFIPRMMSSGCCFSKESRMRAITFHTLQN